MNSSIFKLYFIFLLIFFASHAYGDLQVIAAENVYGQVAEELGGPFVKVTSIINNPNQDPHLFTVSPRIVASLHAADIVVFNGADYDPWMKPLLTNFSGPGQILEVAKLVDAKEGDNPHLWYEPNTMPIFANKITQLYIKLDPLHKNDFIQNLNKFNLEYQHIYSMINKMHLKWNNVDIIATEPLFNEMAQSIGFKMHGLGFQESIMNDVPPSVSQIKSFEDDLNHHSVRLLIYNKQVSNPMTLRMQRLAEKNQIPVAGVTEMLPEGINFVSWILNELTQINNALSTI